MTDPQPRPQMPYPASLPAPQVDYSLNLMDDLITEVTVDGETHRIWTGNSGIESNYRTNNAPKFNALSPDDQAALITWAKDIHWRAENSPCGVSKADLVGN